MSKEEVHFGVPPASLLPARDYKIKMVNDNIVITLPRRGKYNDIAPDAFSEEEGSFDMLSDDTTLYIPSITKVLFAEHKYPDLDSNQLFVIIALDFDEDTVDVYGNIIEILPVG